MLIITWVAIVLNILMMLMCIGSTINGKTKSERFSSLVGIIIYILTTYLLFLFSKTL